MGKFGINVTKLEYILMCLKNQIVVAKCPPKKTHFGTINYHVYSELFHVHSGFSSTRDSLKRGSFARGSSFNRSSVPGTGASFQVQRKASTSHLHLSHHDTNTDWLKADVDCDRVVPSLE